MAKTRPRLKTLKRLKRLDGFGKQLKKLRDRAGLTQQALAEKAGISLSSVVKMEAEDVDPSWTTVLILAEALGARLHEFVYKEEE